jgi:hypothetical protein
VTPAPATFLQEIYYDYGPLEQLELLLRGLVVKKPFTSEYPALAAEWHPSKNGARQPSDFSIGSSHQGWWQCAAISSHVYLQTISTRVKRFQRNPNQRCPLCEPRKVPLSVKFPDVARLWHPTLNGELTPDSVLSRSNENVWWQCEKNQDHIWDAKIKDLARGSRCRICSGNIVHESNSLATHHPEIKLQWHPEKNKPLTPEQVTSHSGKKVWWLCLEGHEWQATVANRTNGNGCPFCSGRYAEPSNTLSVKYPAVAAEWHPSKNRYVHSTPETWHGKKNMNIAPQNRPDKNRRLKPSDLSAYSSELVWWRCSIDRTHVWQAKVCDRTKKQSRCPFCVKRRLTDDYNLQALFPKLVKVWHHSRNLPLLPTQVGPGSQQVVWWQCAKSADHIYKRSVATVVDSWKSDHNGCPFCHGKAVNKSNSLEKEKMLISMWHPERNRHLQPSELTSGSRTEVWWQCPKSIEHIWKAPVSRISKFCRTGTTGCPFCSGLQVTEKESVAGTLPALIPYWDSTRNETKKLSECTRGSHYIAWWRCVKNQKHRWEQDVKSVVNTFKRNGVLCPHCRKSALDEFDAKLKVTQVAPSKRSLVKAKQRH